MKIKQIDGQLIIETNIYQAGNGAVYINWGNTVIKLEEDYADSIARDIPDFDNDAYNNYYITNKVEKK